MVTSEPLQYANGVLLVDDGKTLLVNDLYEGTTNVYEVDPYTKDLILERKVVSSLRKELATDHEHLLTPANTNFQRLGGTPDNLAQIPTNGDIVVPGKSYSQYFMTFTQWTNQSTVFPNLVTLFQRGFGSGGLDYGTFCESAIVRLSKEKGYAPELLFWDDGKQLSVLTGADVDPYNKRIIAGGMFSKAFLVCDIKDDKTGVAFG